MMLWLALPQFAVAFGAVICSKTVRDDRNYHPMLKVIFAAVAFIFAGGGVNSLGQWATQEGVRATFVLVMLMAVGYAAWFIRKRNRTKRWVRVTVGGHIEFRPVEEMEQITILGISYAEHGDMPERLMDKMEEAIREGRRKRRWAANLQAQVDERRARRAGRPGGGGKGE